MTTTMKTALQKAGYDTARVELETLADRLLKNSRPDKVLPGFVRELESRRELLGRLALEYLRSRATKTGAASGHLPDDTHSTTAAAAPVKVKGYKIEAHRRQLPRNANDIAAEKAAWVASADATWRIKDRQIGDIQFNEIGKLRGDLARAASLGLMRNIGDAVNCIGLKKISEYAVVDDGSKLVRDVVPPDRLKEIYEQAKLDAPPLIANLMQVISGKLNTIDLELEHARD